MSRRYKSSQSQELYNNFLKMFEEEGDVYDSIVESINEGYEHKQMGNNLGKILMLNILDDVTIDFYADKIKILTEKEFLNEYNKRTAK